MLEKSENSKRRVGGRDDGAVDHAGTSLDADNRIEPFEKAICDECTQVDALLGA